MVVTVCNNERNNFLIFGSFLVVFKISRGISLALNMLTSISDFALAMLFFQFLEELFIYIFSFNNRTYSSFQREWYIC